MNAAETIKTIEVYKGEEAPENRAGRITISPYMTGLVKINLAILADSARLTIFADTANQDGIDAAVARCRALAMSSSTMADNTRRAMATNEARGKRQAARHRRRAYRR